MKKFFLGCLALCLGCETSASLAAPPTSRLTTVSWVLATRHEMKMDNRYVTLIGRVTEKIGDETYLFNDGTGSIQLDSEKFDLPVGRKIVIGGRIDQAYFGIGHTEIDVRQWHEARSF